MKTSYQRGQQAEQQAAQFLSQQGLNILDTNFRYQRGEIDIIAQQAEKLIFVEVRYRQHSAYGDGLESITPIKRHRLINTARFYLWKTRQQERNCRFDVISIDKQNIVTWIQGAFHIDYATVF